ncbi:MAG: hypothetical protein KAS32_28020 [Candidatus Peribacteraceae bacterium]|nr:hypothetical protein [Candidatus Peribacteraceae bacterium]
MDKEKSYEFYKSFYDDHRVEVLLYANLRKYFTKMVEDVLGKDYYNMGMDVYTCDKLCCEDMTRKLKSFWGSL